LYITKLEKTEKKSKIFFTGHILKSHREQTEPTAHQCTVLPTHQATSKAWARILLPILGLADFNRK
jgi:hypothetical protein